MAFRVNEVLNDISRTNNVALQSHYEMLVRLPLNITQNQPVYNQVNSLGMDLFSGRDLAFRIDTTEFPGRSITNTVYRDYGVIRKIAYDSNYIDVTATVLMSSDFREKVFFELWQDLIVGNFRFNNIGGDNPATRAYAIGYYQDYTSDLEIQQYDEEGNVTYVCKLIDAYPQLVAPVSASWAISDAQKLNIVFSYRYFMDFVVRPGRHIPTQLRTGSWFFGSGLAGGLGAVGGAAASRFLSAKQTQAAVGAVAIGRQVAGIFDI